MSYFQFIIYFAHCRSQPRVNETQLISVKVQLLFSFWRVLILKSNNQVMNKITFLIATRFVALIYRNCPRIIRILFFDTWKIDSTRIFYNWDVYIYFIWSKLKIKRKIEQQYFQIRSAYYIRKYGYSDILRAKVGVRNIRGCVSYADDYGSVW